MEKIIINGKSCEAEKGSLLSRVLQENINFQMPCGQRGVCGKCKVFAEGDLSHFAPAELEKLTQEEREAGIRLACMTFVEGPCEVTAKAERKASILLGGEPGAAQSGRLAADGAEPADAAPRSGSDRAAGGKRLFQKLGAAIDIGTTTLAAQLFDENGMLAQAGEVNPQEAFGADVISRMEKSLDGDAKALAQSIRQGLSKLLEQLAQLGNRQAAEIDTVVITGNTAMLYFLMERDPECLSHAPFEADWLAGEWISGADLALCCPAARVYLTRCMSAFVGGDITTALLATGIHHTQDLRLLVDIGTNGEIALWKDGRLFCCSTAAGPAFEGAGLSMGMQGEEGAISHVKLTEGGLQAEVIGGGRAKGICGSGVVDAVSCLLESEEMDETGFLEDEEAVICDAVTLDQADIRKVQLAKSAICAGIKAMLHQAGMETKDLAEMLVAGGFGSYLNLENAIKIGLLPETEVSKITVCGNAALAGAVKILLDGSCIQESVSLAECAHTLNLASDDYFKDNYMEGMLF